MHTTDPPRPASRGNVQRHGYKVKRPLYAEAGQIYVPLGYGRCAVVDLEDHDKVAGYNWSLHADGYAVRSWLQSESDYPGACYLHRWITDCPHGMEVDHVDGDPLNNRRSNLRIGTHRDNLNNRAVAKKDATCRLKGVRRVGRGFTAGVQHKDEHYHLGTYRDPLHAWVAASIARECLHGRFANHGADPFKAAARKRLAIG